MTKIDFGKLAQDLLLRARFLVEDWIPGGDWSGPHYKAINPKRGDDSIGSFSINTSSGVWKDFASDDGGGDLISLYAWLRDLKQGEAAAELLRMLGALPPEPQADKRAKPGKPKWVPIIPVPEGVPQILRVHFEYGTPARIWTYCDAAGRALCYVYRFDPTPENGLEKKEVWPLTWCKEEGGSRVGWHWKGLPNPRPLLGLDRLAAAPTDASVIFVEGEGKVDAMRELWPEAVAMCGLGGAKSAKYLDFEPLRGRRVILWRDNDDEGLKFAREVTAILLGLGCEVAWVRIPAGKPEKWDSKDAWLIDGWTREYVAGLIQAGEFFGPPDLSESKRVPAAPKIYGENHLPFDLNAPPWPAVTNWHISKSGLQDINLQYIAFKPIWVEAVTRNIYGSRGLQIKFFDLDWILQTICLPARILNEQGGVLGKELADIGFPVIPGKEKWISRYLTQCMVQAEKRIFASTRLGWYDNNKDELVFILPSQVLGSTADEIAYQPESYSRTVDNLKGAGPIVNWQKYVRDECRGNPFLMFALMMGLAGPLLKPARVENGGFNFYGTSTGGKTTMAQVCASVWGAAGDPQQGPEHTIIQSWDNTATALENTAEIFNDLTLCLDEIGKADPFEVGRAAYKLIGGSSKGRGKADGGLRSMKTWRVLVLSTGELSVRQVVAKVKQEMKAGQRVRFADVPVDDERGRRGIIVDTHGKRKPREFADDLKAACSRHFGIAGPTFVGFLIRWASSVGSSVFAGQLSDEMKAIEKVLRGNTVNGQYVEIVLPEEMHRVIKRFALIALAGIYAGQAGILDWPLEEIIFCVKSVRDTWISEQGESKSESERALAHVRDMLIRHGGRFMPIDTDKDSATWKDRLGYRTNDYFVLTAMGLQEICGDFDTRSVLHELKNIGLLWHDKGKDTHKSCAIKAMGGARPYLYWISMRILGELDLGQTAEDAALTEKEKLRKRLAEIEAEEAAEEMAGVAF